MDKWRVVTHKPWAAPNDTDVAVVVPRRRIRKCVCMGDGSHTSRSRACLYDTVIGRHVAIKVLPTELGAEPGYRERFRRRSTGLNRGHDE